MATLSMDALTWFRKQVEAADADLLREMITTFAGTLMSRSEPPGTDLGLPS